MLGRLVQTILASRRARRFDALLARGQSAQERNDLGRAIGCYRAALAIVPQHADTLCRLGSVLQLAGKKTEAIATLRAAVAAAPRSRDAYRLLARALAAPENAERGTNASAPSLGEPKADRPAAFFDALLHSETGDRDGSRSLRIRRILPSRFLLHAEQCLAQERVQEALDAIRAGARCFPGDRELTPLAAQLTADPVHINDIARIRQAVERIRLRPAAPSPEFFVQRVPVTRLDDRMALFGPLCAGKKVLHVGCTDHPIFDPANNLHLQLREICAELDGLDIDEEGLDTLRRFAPGRYYASAAQAKGPYDVILAPETIEHVGDIRKFLEELSGIPFGQCLITAPNAFLPRDNGNRFEGDSTYVEHVHPDHDCWFSPNTLRTCISKYTPWAIRENFLLENDSVVACLCDYRPRWELKRIPKKVHFYWGNERTSFLRFLSVWSFRKFNPDWEINLYVPTTTYRGDIPWTTGEGYDGTGFTGRDYSRDLFGIPGLRIHGVDFSAFPAIAEAPENYKSDFFRWHILSEQGGLYSDIDILFLRPLADFHLNLQANQDAEAVICLQEAGNIIGFLFAAPGSAFYRRLLERSIDAFNTRTYQAISAPMVNTVYPSMQSIREAFPDMLVLNMPMTVVYALDHSVIPDIFHSTDLARLQPETIGIHWYAGHPVAQEFNNVVTHENFHQFDGILFQSIQRIYRR